MGLDNGLCIKRNDKAINIYNLIARFESNWDREHRYDFEVLYYRKCWNIRNLIFDCIDCGVDNGITTVNRDHIPKIIDALKSLNADNWEDNGDSIWTFKDQETYIAMHIENLEYLYKIMEEYDLDLYFYDSY